MKRNKPRTLRLGIISEATLNLEDLIPSYLWELERLRLTRPERKVVRDIRRASEAEDYYDGGPNPIDDMVELSDILDAHCPPYAHFGSLRDYGACIGVWPSLDSLQRDIEDEGWELRDTDRNGGGTRVSPDGRWRWVVSDHGNGTLYRNGREVWSVV